MKKILKKISNIFKQILKYIFLIIIRIIFSICFNVKMFVIGGILKYLFDLIPVKRDGRDSLGIKKAYEVINNNGILRNISRRNKKRLTKNR